MARRPLVALAVALVLLAGCASPSPAPPPRVSAEATRPSPPRAFDAQALASELRLAGLEAAAPEPTSTAVFGGSSDPKVIVAGGRGILVYTFPTAEEASKVASAISPDGSSGPFEGNAFALVEWRDPPHFFRRERLIVTYLQSGYPTATPADSRTLRALGDVLGPQFAGYR